MAWMIEKNNQIAYDVKTHKLTTAKGESIAWLHELANGNLQISLAMNTDFHSEDGKLNAVGWNGCEEHVLSVITLASENGTLDYQEGRAFGKEGLKILVNIRKVDHILIPIPKDAPWEPKRTFLQLIFGR